MRKTRPALTLLLACLVIFALAPAAAAQLPLDPLGGVGDPLGGSTGGSSGGGSGGGGGIGDLTSGIGDQEGTSEPDGSPDESDSKLLNDLAKDINETVHDPGTKVDETVEDPSGSIGGTIGDTEQAAAKDVKDFSKGLTNPTRKGGKKKAPTDNVGFGHAAGAQDYDKVFAASLAARLADAKDRTRSSRLSSAVDTEDTGFTGVIQTIGRVAAEAAQQAAFPLLLTLLVGAFLIGQNRIDSRDPKLALAPLDSEQDLLSFT